MKRTKRAAWTYYNDPEISDKQFRVLVDKIVQVYSLPMYVNYKIEQITNCDFIIIALSNKEYKFKMEIFNDKIYIDNVDAIDTKTEQAVFTVDESGGTWF